MLKTYLTATALSLTLALPAMADDLPVSQIDVATDAASVEGSTALTYWPKIAEDAGQFLASAFADDLAEDGYRLDVMITGIELDGSPELDEDGRFNKLTGQVSIYKGNEIVGTTVPLIVTAELAEQTEPVPGVILSRPDVPAFYTAMLIGFADLAQDEVNDTTLRALSD